MCVIVCPSLLEGEKKRGGVHFPSSFRFGRLSQGVVRLLKVVVTAKVLILVVWYLLNS